MSTVLYFKCDAVVDGGAMWRSTERGGIMARIHSNPVTAGWNGGYGLNTKIRNFFIKFLRLLFKSGDEAVVLERDSS
jgi:hypothetical protein